jgi:hypothetical protein
MKKTSLFFVIAFFMTACSDTIEEFVTYEKITPIIITMEEFRATSVKVETPHTLQNVGKIYTYNQYLFINERGKGIHVIDNRNPSAPVRVSFLNILGNIDIAIRNNVLYADCVIDLVRFDVSNPAQPIFLSRQENVLPNPYQFYVEAGKIVVDTKREKIREKRSASENTQWQGGFFFSPNVNLAATSSNPNMVGTGGSMARFAIVNQYLYVLTHSNIITFNIAGGEAQKITNTPIGFDLETIFPYNGNLFIGSMNGMYVVSLENPTVPETLSFVGHFPSCDPVVVEGNYAYVTLRVGTTCTNAVNELQVYDISDLKNPQLIKTYPMANPHGLGIQNNVLFICEGRYGLKIFDASNKNEIDKNMQEHIKNIHAYDVIPMGNILMMIGENGLFQYNVSNPKNPQLLSSLRVN